MISAELTYVGSKNPDGSAYFQNLDSDDENKIAGNDDADEAKTSEESKEGAAQHLRMNSSEARNSHLVVSQRELLKLASLVKTSFGAFCGLCYLGENRAGVRFPVHLLREIRVSRAF